MTAPACPLTAEKLRLWAEVWSAPAGEMSLIDNRHLAPVADVEMAASDLALWLASEMEAREKAEAERDFCKQAANDWRELYESSRPQQSRPISATNPGDEAVTK